MLTGDSISTRREFLKRSLALLALAPTVPSFLDQTVLALADPQDVKRTQRPSGRDGKILVVVQLSGGNDGLNMIVPHGEDVYYRERPTLAIDAKAVLKIDDHVGMHPNLASLKALYDKGRVAVVQGVGYPNPNRSHFRSMDIWHSAQPEREQPVSGWIGRYFDNACAGYDPDVGISIGGRLPLAMQGQRIMPLSLERPEAYRYAGRDRRRYEALIGGGRMGQESGNSAPAAGSPAGQLHFLERTALDAQVSSDEILRFTRAHTPPASYPPGRFGRALKTIAAMIRGGMPTRVYYASLGGFDTHANQRARHDQLMQELADGLKAFWADLEDQKNDDRVLLMTFSEFGRRVAQNASNGTDHGAAAPMLLFGTRIQQGLIGTHPSLADLDRGDLKHTVDFRSVYAAVLEKWLDTPSEPILGKRAAPLPAALLRR